MWYKHLYIFLLLGSFCGVSSPYAQPPNPPPGWEYVMDLDSLDIFEFHPYGDTIFMVGHDAHTAIQEDFRIVSFDGGKNWDTIIPPEINTSGGKYNLGFFPTEAKIWFINEDTTIRFYTSENGKSYQKIEVGKDSSNAMGGLGDFLIDPHDPNHWFWIGVKSVMIYVNSGLAQSFNAGQTWHWENVPVIPAEKLNMELRFDSRREGVWYVHVIAKQHHTQSELDTDYVVRTTDNAIGFELVKKWGTHFGIGGFGEVRAWYVKPEYTVYGPAIGNDTSDKFDTINWLALFHPSLPFTDYNSGYYRTLSEYKDISSEEYPSNFQYLFSDPLDQSIVEYETKFDPSTYFPNSFRSWVYHTTDDWKSKEILWDGIENLWVSQTFLDQKGNKLYAYVNSFKDSNITSNPRYFKSFLYKYQLQKSAVGFQVIPNIPVFAFPMPSQGKIQIVLPEKELLSNAMSLYNTQGIEILNSINNFSFSQGIVEWSIPELVPSGLYFLKIRTDRKQYLVKVLLQR
jgi:hypothetical protein